MSEKTSMINIENVSFTYPPPNRVQALKNVSLNITNGEFVALIGQNGSGKTTLAKCISGFLKPTKGSIRINGRDTHNMRTSDLAQEVGYVFQNPDHQLFKESVYDEIAFGLKNIGKPKEDIEKKVREVLDRMHLWEFRDLHPFRLGKGQRQRVAISAILAMEPEILVIDEPTTGQDRREARAIMDLTYDLNKEGVTAVVITHAMSLVAEYTKRTVALCEGQILIDGTTREVFRETDLLSHTFVEPPQITMLGNSLAFNPAVLTVDEAKDAIMKKIGKA
ncbi:energy-coupling factor ABC transporter ATP-binding protein [[Eubacterium] cellulosolvens]